MDTDSRRQCHLPFDTAYTYTTGGIDMYEYHVDVVDDEVIDQYVLEENSCHGGNRSV